jgi:large subunit ribosomal protein L1
MKKRSKRYSVSEKVVDYNKVYKLKEAIALLKQMSPTKFDGSIDLHFDLNVDTKKSDQMVRGTVILPHGTGKKVRVAVFCKGEHEKEARDAHADHVGGTELIEKVAGGFMDFDVCLATPEMMKDLSRLGKVLGPRGLMPSPKSGTVTPDVAKAVQEFKAGKIEYRTDSGGNVHAPVGKKSFAPEDLKANIEAFIEHIRQARPGAAKGRYILGASVSTTMSPGIPLAVSS